MKALLSSLIASLLVLNCLTIYPDPDVSGYNVPAYEANASQAPVREALQGHGLSHDGRSLITIDADKSKLNSTRCIIPALFMFLIPCWDNEQYEVTFEVKAPLLDSSKRELVKTNIENTQIYFFPFFLFSPFIDDTDPFTGGLDEAALKAAPDIQTAVQSMQAWIQEKKKKIDRVKANRQQFPIVINEFLFAYDYRSSYSKSVTLDFYNNTGKEITEITIKFAPAPSIFVITPVKPVGPFAYVERTIKMRVPPGGFATETRYSDVGSSEKVNAVFLEAITLRFADGTTAYYNAYRVKNMIEEAPRQLFQ
ncbi:MAG TPA: hypothetical protein DEA96_14645 [Leptospiraceae bacterium]|nr:hypothetical protein [Spirochaetaceae bacterium]HBS06204.1 hypothetical protein [Leptospiraceae bacterium]|tara:strand:+ start:9428 stop:10354 length:927 start_codon:yes stop_codon:yes gene_type:complete